MGMVLMNAVMLQVAFLLCRDPQLVLIMKFLSVPRIQSGTLPQNDFEEVTACFEVSLEVLVVTIVILFKL